MAPQGRVRAATVRAGRRLGASALDLLVVAGWVVVAAVVAVLAKWAGVDLAASELTSNLTAFAVLVAPVVVTFAAQDSSASRATFGKRRLGLQVVDRDGGRVGLPRALARESVRFSPWVLAHVAVFGLARGSDWPGYLVLAVLAQVIVLASVVMMAADRQGRAIHDWCAGTRVVAATAPPATGP